MKIRKATETDIDQVWEIFSKVIETGDTYVFNPNTPKKDLKKLCAATVLSVKEKDIL